MSRMARMMMMRGGNEMSDRDTGAGSVTGGGSGNRDEMRGGRMESGMAYEQNYGEARRRRYSNGRFAPSGSYGGYHEMEGEMRGGRNRIGFEMDGGRMEMRYGGGMQEEQMRGHGSSMSFRRIDRRVADQWVQEMQEESGMELWPREMTRQIARKNGMSGLDENEFYAVYNAMYTDFCEVAKDWGVDKPDFFADLARAFLEDEDAVEDKAAAYYACIVRHE